MNIYEMASNNKFLMLTWVWDGETDPPEILYQSM